MFLPASGSPTACRRADTADAVVVGGGTVGAWCAYFLRRSGLDRWCCSRSARSARARAAAPRAWSATQGGTVGGPPRRVVPPLLPRPARGARHRLRVHPAGLPPAVLHRGRRRPPRTNGSPCRTSWACRSGGSSRTRSTRLNPTLAPGLTRGGTFCADDGYLTPPRNVTAYAVALAVSGVAVAERTSFTGLVTSHGRVTGVQTSRGRISAAAGRAHRRPRTGRGRRPGRAQDPGRRRAPSGGGHRAAPRPGPGRGADGVRPRPPGCTGARRRRACCSA